MNQPSSVERRPCGCLYRITWGTDGESLVEACQAHGQPSGPQQDALPDGSTPGNCSRCGKGIQLTTDVMTIGYYNVAPGGAWAQFARPLETAICDQCMWADPKYRQVNGQYATPPEVSGAEVWDDDGA